MLEHADRLRREDDVGRPAGGAAALRAAGLPCADGVVGEDGVRVGIVGAPGLLGSAALARRREVDGAAADGGPVVALEGWVEGAVEGVAGGQGFVVAGSSSSSSGAGSADGEGFLGCGSHGCTVAG